VINKIEKYNSLFAYSLFFLALLVVVLITNLPTNMDEFLPYHSISCDQSKTFSKLNDNFREGCSKYRTSFAGFEYTRSYAYVGKISSILYYPIYFIKNNLEAYYLFEFIFVILSAFLISRITQGGLLGMIIPITYLPLTYSLVHDTGPIKISVVMLLLTILIGRSLLSNINISNYSYIHKSLLIFLFVSVAIEDKPFFLYLLPAIYIFIVYTKNKENIKFSYSRQRLLFDAHIRYLTNISLIAILFVLAAFTLLFFLKVKHGDNFVPYIRFLFGWVSGTSISFFDQISKIFYSSFFDLYFLERNFDFYSFSLVNLTLLSLSGILVKLIWIKNYLFIDHKSLLSILSILIVFLLLGNASQPHHFVFLHIFILISIIRWQRNNQRSLLIISGLFLINSFLNIYFISSKDPYKHASYDREEIFTFLTTEETLKDSLVNFSSWGGSYQQSLFGPIDQVVTFTGELNEKIANDLVDSANSLKKDSFYNICFNCNEESMRLYFPEKKINEVNIGTNTWKVFRIFL